MRGLKCCDNECSDIYSLTLNIPMDDDFAIAFAAGNIDRDSRLKKIHSKVPAWSRYKHFCEDLMNLYPLYRMSVLSQVISAPFIPSSVFPLLKKVISSVHNYLITVY